MILYRNTKVKERSPDGDMEYFDIVAGVLQGDTLASYLFKKSLNTIKRTLFVKRKVKSYFPQYRANIFKKIGIRVYYRLYNKAENISNALKEAGEVISDGLLIAMVLKGWPPNFKPFTTVITQKKKTLTFSEFKLCLRSYEETERTCYPTQMNLTI